SSLPSDTYPPPPHPPPTRHSSDLLTTLEENAGLEAYINVPVQEAPKLKNGLPVRLVDESGKVLANERISFISPSVDDQTQTVLRSEEHTSELQSRFDFVCRLLLEK